MTDKEKNTTEEEVTVTNEETQESAAVDKQQKAVKDSVQEVAAATSVSSPVSGFAAPAVAPSKKSAAPIWMVVSAVLLIALVFVMVKNPLDSGKKEVASVNGVKITKDDLYSTMVTQGGKSMLSSMIMQEVVAQEAKKNNINVTDADIDKEIENIKKNAGGDAAFAQMLTQYNYTVDQLRKEMLPQVQLEKLLAPKVTVTDDEIKQYYDQNKASFATPEQVHAAHILVKTKEEADDILKQLKAGADFATLAKEKSTDTGSKDNGGDLNYFSKGQMVKEFEEAAFSLKAGELSDAVKTDYGYHIIKVIDHKAAVEPTLEDKKADIKETLTQQKTSQMSSSYITELEAKAKVTNTLDPKAAQTTTPAATSGQSTTDTTQSTDATKSTDTTKK